MAMIAKRRLTVFTVYFVFSSVGNYTAVQSSVLLVLNFNKVCLIKNFPTSFTLIFDNYRGTLKLSNFYSFFPPLILTITNAVPQNATLHDHLHCTNGCL
jgi:hypothetical protein